VPFAAEPPAQLTHSPDGEPDTKRLRTISAAYADADDDAAAAAAEADCAMKLEAEALKAEEGGVEGQKEEREPGTAVKLEDGERVQAEQSSLAAAQQLAAGCAGAQPKADAEHQQLQKQQNGGAVLEGSLKVWGQQRRVCGGPGAQVADSGMRRLLAPVAVPHTWGCLQPSSQLTQPAALPLQLHVPPPRGPTEARQHTKPMHH
jgi:hypothetical protein